MSKGETSSDRLPNGLVLCVVAPLTPDQISRRWEQLGASVMQTIKLHDSSGGFRVSTLRIKKWVGRDSSASTLFFARNMVRSRPYVHSEDSGSWQDALLSE